MKRITEIVLLALFVTAVVGLNPAAAGGLNGSQLRLRDQKGDPEKLTFRGEASGSLTWRTFTDVTGPFRFVEMVDLGTIGFNGTVHRGPWFVNGGASWSITDDSANDLDSEQFNIGGGYQFEVSRTFTYAPVINYYNSTNQFRVGNQFGFDGVGFGLNWKWAPGYSEEKAFAHWAFFGFGIYYPSLGVDSPFGNLDGDSGYQTGFGVERNFTKNIYGSVAAEWNCFGASNRSSMFSEDNLAIYFALGSRGP